MKKFAEQHYVLDQSLAMEKTMYLDSVYNLTALEEAAELGFKAGYEDYFKGIDLRNSPYTVTAYGELAASLTTRWYSGYSMGQVTAHRHQFDIQREEKMIARVNVKSNKDS